MGGTVTEHVIMVKQHYSPTITGTQDEGAVSWIIDCRPTPLLLLDLDSGINACNSCIILDRLAYDGVTQQTQIGPLEVRTGSLRDETESP